MLVIFGSINLTAQYHVKTLPTAGQEVKAQSFLFEAGGHAARQAIAAARYDTKTALIAKVGEDANGVRLVNNLKRNNVVTSGIAQVEEVETGLVTEIVDQKGQRQVVTATGANDLLSAEQVPENIVSTDNILLVQPDLLLEETVKVMMLARQQGGKIILYFSPFIKLPKEVLTFADIIIIPEEFLKNAAAHLSLSGENAAEIGKQMGVLTSTDIIIFGKQIQAIPLQKEGKIFSMPDLPDLVQTENAMDAFSGILAASLHDGDGFDAACKKATIASTLAQRHHSAQSAFPYRSDIEELL